MSLILELQRDALDLSVPVAAVLFKAAAVSRKLSEPGIAAWLESELTGYPDRTRVPDYRMAFVVVEVQDFTGAMSQLDFPATAFGVSEPIAYLQRVHDKRETLPYPAPSMSTPMGNTLPTYYIVRQVAVERILTTVRHKVLNWALELEQLGVLGENMTFSAKEREQALKVTVHVHQDPKYAEAVAAIGELLARSLGISNDDERKKAQEALEALQEQVDRASDGVPAGFMERLGKAVRDVKDPAQLVLIASELTKFFLP